MISCRLRSLHARACSPRALWNFSAYPPVCRRRSERVARTRGERGVGHDERVVPEHQRRLVAVRGEVGAEPGRLFRRQAAGVAATARLVVGVEPDHVQAGQVGGEVRRLVAREVRVVEAVVALPLPRAAGGVRVPAVRAVVVPARDEVVLAVGPELAEEVPGPAEVGRHGLGGDVPGRQQVGRIEPCDVAYERVQPTWWYGVWPEIPPATWFSRAGCVP
jgi:hypothetical protein